MSCDLFLFDNNESHATEQPEEKPIARWQIDLLRKALDSRGLTDMTERQQAISAAVGHNVESLKTLTHDEALQALNRLAEDRSKRPRTTSAWDDRDQDTWIDRI